MVGGRLPCLVPGDDAERLAGLFIGDLEPVGQRDAEAEACRAQARRRLERDLDEAGGERLARFGEAPAVEAVRLDVEVQAVEAVAIGRGLAEGDDGVDDGERIGRASCRERVSLNV